MPKEVACPTCRTLVAWEGNPFRPFCSERCRVVDLAAWATGRHRIPGEPIPPEAPDDGDEER